MVGVLLEGVLGTVGPQLALPAGREVSRHDGVLGTVVSVERLASVVIPPKTP